MPTIVNKTFEEIAVGDGASTQRTLQAGDVHAWAAAFGEADTRAGPGETQVAAGIVTATLTALAGSALPGPGSAIRTISVQIKAALPIGAAMTARLVVREKRPNQGIGCWTETAPASRSGGCDGQAGRSGTDDTTATRDCGTSA